MTDGRFAVGDVVWAPDPYTDGGPRPWLVLAADALPFAGEEYVCAALTTTDHRENLAVGDAWAAGGHPARRSFCSPWLLATVKHDAIRNPQGRVSTGFVERVVDRSVAYLTAEAGG